jgi:ribose transport system ATP-binding protein
MSQPQTSLSIRRLCKSFNGVQVLKDVDLEIRPGEVHGLLGENGSGKSTMIKVLAGFHTPDEGEMTAWGREVPLPLAPGQFREIGLEFVHQDLGLIPSLSVLENLRLGRLAARRGPGPVNWSRERAAGAALLERYGVHLDLTAQVSELLPVEKALVAIVRGIEDMTNAMARNGPDRGVLFLDEPTAFLPRDHVDQLFGLVERIVGTGASVVIVSHDLDEVYRITDRVTVLRNGEKVGTVITADTDISELTRMIVGRELGLVEPLDERFVGTGDPVLALEDVQTAALSDVTLELRAGEVLGVTGLVGSGFEELPYAVFGTVPMTRGRMRLFGNDVPLGRWTPARSIAAGIALIPGDRARDGSVASLPLSDNLMQLSVGDHFRQGFLRLRSLRREAHGLMQEFDVRPLDPGLSYGSFSGGNQQKALMAKWLHRRPKIVLVHEPTQGVDIGARQTIHQLIRTAAADGTAVICASSDYEQMAAICDRVLIFAEGRVHRELTGSSITKETITEECLVSVVSTPTPQEKAS